MLIPMPAPQLQTDTPSVHAASQQPMMMFILSLQTMFCILRIIPVLDILGGFIMAIGIGVGWYAWNQGMHITFVCYWGMMSLVNGAFDLVHFIDFEVHRGDNLPLFSANLPAVYNIYSAVLLIGPLTQLIGAGFAYHFYKLCTTVEDDGNTYRGRDSQRRTSTRGSWYQPQDEAAPIAVGGSTNFQAFQGSGQRLGSM
mmetsp:Transcript_33435/g.61334  ORF Transcript_33435/g.61334 Transcript_33435/m.61334 type:complete len:198 (+) Transcript_33435:75-668(+)